MKWSSFNWHSSKKNRSNVIKWKEYPKERRRNAQTQMKRQFGNTKGKRDIININSIQFNSRFRIKIAMQDKFRFQTIAAGSVSGAVTIAAIAWLGFLNNNACSFKFLSYELRFLII